MNETWETLPLHEQAASAAQLEHHANLHKLLNLLSTLVCLVTLDSPGAEILGGHLRGVEEGSSCPDPSCN